MPVSPRTFHAIAASFLVACSADSERLEVPPPALDAGEEASAADAGQPDAARDGAVPSDAGLTDSGLPDAGRAGDAASDSGLTDAGLTDSGITDAGLTDSGITDGAATDAGPADAGLADGGRTDAASIDAALPTDGASSAYAHTIAIDGVNDFSAAETFPTTTPGFAFYAAWDASYVYFGASGNDVRTGAAATKWWVLYVSRSAGSGSTTGVRYNTQEPTLPFAAGAHVRWKTTDDYTNALGWNGTAWTDLALPFSGSVFRSATTNFVELRLARAALGNPQVLRVVSALLNEANGSEATFAGAPSTAFVDGYNRSFAKGFSLDLAQGPASATVVP